MATEIETQVPTILIVDDVLDSLVMISLTLQSMGFRVLTSENGRNAIEVARLARPDLILMDGSLPRVDGFDATRRIRRFGHAGHLPIVFVSGHAEAAFLALAREAGCDEYLVKPCGMVQLGGVLEKYLSHNAPAFAI